MTKRECQQRLLEAFKASDKSSEAVRILLGGAFQYGWQAAVDRRLDAMASGAERSMLRSATGDCTPGTK